MQMLRSSMLPTSSADPFRAFMKFCGGRDSWRDAGVLIRERTYPPANSKKSKECADLIRICKMTLSLQSTLMTGFARLHDCLPFGSHSVDKCSTHHRGGRHNDPGKIVSVLRVEDFSCQPGREPLAK